MLGISGTELVIILFFGFLIFGPEKLPAMGRTVGRAIRQFREASDAANQKFREEVYDPFKEAVEPYADQVKEQGAPLKEDLDAISGTFKETKEMLTDPFGFKGGSDKGGGGAGREGGSIKNMVGDMVKDPFGIEADKKAERDASVQESVAQADAIIEALEAEDGAAQQPQGQPLPDAGGTVKKGLAESLYGLDGAAKGGE